MLRRGLEMPNDNLLRTMVCSTRTKPVRDIHGNIRGLAVHAFMFRIQNLKIACSI